MKFSRLVPKQTEKIEQSVSEKIKNKGDNFKMHEENYLVYLCYHNSLREEEK